MAAKWTEGGSTDTLLLVELGVLLVDLLVLSLGMLFPWLDLLLLAKSSWASNGGDGALGVDCRGCCCCSGCCWAAWLEDFFFLPMVVLG